MTSFITLLKKTACCGEIEPVDPGFLVPAVPGSRNIGSCIRDLSLPQVYVCTLKKGLGTLRVQGKSYGGNIPTQRSFKSPQGIAQWSALAAHWTLCNTYRKEGTATLDTGGHAACFQHSIWCPWLTASLRRKTHASRRAQAQGGAPGRNARRPAVVGAPAPENAAATRLSGQPPLCDPHTHLRLLAPFHVL